MHKQHKLNKEQIQIWLDNFFENIENYLDSNKKHTITDLLKLMPEECGREYVRRGNEAFGQGMNLPGYDQIMNRKEQNDTNI